MKESGRFQLGRNLLDGLLDIRGRPCACAHELAASEEQDRSLRLLEAIDQPGELLRLVLRSAEDEGDRLQVELLPEGSRRDDVFNLVVRRGNTTEGRSVAHGTGFDPTQVVRYIVRAPRGPLPGCGPICEGAPRGFVSRRRGWVPDGFGGAIILDSGNESGGQSEALSHVTRIPS